ncbi:PPE family protein [Mycobacterium parmense]|uniref:PPE family protein n=1 Tax=Mycobacterium parmense TaxID=185642 RepID=A0A7I7YPK1_9MYCO|nr:PPE family protein [Mycobacterium parmense]MCV7349255.1 PPE family protein [Mycobacterium parmense]ORW57216.1 hypothetical protein AWC20_13930 [Mycobacterium parmense]BBZ42863.1 PPE family protein [Mycobacterium parmense]
MFDFGALPPEINSARMYMGPGSGPLMAAASAWDALAAQLESYSAGYSSTLIELQGLWSGGASFAMAGAVAPYVAWVTTTATQAEQTASQARAAAAAFETAFAATVPPPVIAANRIQLAVLVATNFFGQNTPAIAATEAQYAQMWAQDAVAMYDYAASSSVATVLTQFSRPSTIANATGQSDQAAAVTEATATPAGQTQAAVAELMSALPQQLQALSTGSSSSSTPLQQLESLIPAPVLTAFKDFNTVLGNNASVANLPAQFSRTTTSAGSMGTGLNLAGAQAAKAAAKAAAAQADAVGPGAVRGPVLVSVGNAAPVGRLSVPQSWVTANPVAAAGSSTPLADSGVHAAPAAAGAHAGPNTLGGIPKGNAEPTGSFVLRNGRRRFQMPRPPYGG